MHIRVVPEQPLKERGNLQAIDLIPDHTWITNITIHHPITQHPKMKRLLSNFINAYTISTIEYSMKNQGFLNKKKLERLLYDSFVVFQ